MGKKRVAVFGDFEAEEKLRQQKAVERQQKKLREGKKLSKAEVQAAELTKQTNKQHELDKLDIVDPIMAMRAEMSRLKQEKEKSSPVDTGSKVKTSTKKLNSHPRSTKYLNKKSKIARTESQSPQAAIQKILKLSYSKFPGSIELHLNLRKKDNFTSSTVELPHSTGKTKKAVALSPEIISDLDNKKINFDVLFASADQMKDLVKYAKLLGPRGLMPNPKNGTITPDPIKAVANFKASTVTLKTEPKAAIVHTIIGKTDMSADHIYANYQAVIKSFESKNLINVFMAATMSPVVKVDFNS